MGLADWNPFLGLRLLSLGACCLPDSSGPGPAGGGCFRGYSGTAPGRAGEAFTTLGQLPRCPGSPWGASPAGGLGRGVSGRACSLARPWGGRSLRAEGRAGLAWPQLGRCTRCVNPGLRGGSGHRDGGGIVRAAGRIHVGRPIHGVAGRVDYCPAKRGEKDAVREGTALLGPVGRGEHPGRASGYWGPIPPESAKTYTCQL